MNLINSPTAEQSDFCSIFMHDVHEILGDKLHSFYIYGAMMFPRPVNWRVDVDFHIIVGQPLQDDERERIMALHKHLAQDQPLGKELDGYYILLSDAKQTVDPTHVVWTSAVDFAWSLHRAHVHAGKYQLLYGKDPQTFLPKASWDDCLSGLQNELQFIKDHPEYPQFGILNICRLLWSWYMHSVVTSKYEAAQWALSNLDSHWRSLIEAALRDYMETGQNGDRELMEKDFSKFLKYFEAKLQFV